MKQALASLHSIEPGVEVHGKLPWPIAFNTAGKQALYVFAADLFLLNLDSSTFYRLTQTPEEEKDPQFSPNGRFISFVRENNLYLWDVTAKKETQLTHDGSPTWITAKGNWASTARTPRGITSSGC